MKKMLLVLTILALTGCATEPTMFGMPEGQFKQLTPKQQSQVIDSYNKQQEINAKNKPITDTVSTIGSLGQQAIWNQK